MKPNRRFPVLFSALTAVFAVQSASAAVRYWDGGSGNWSGGTSGLTKWSTASGAATPDPTAAPGINDDLFFNITTANTTANTVSFANAARSAKSLTFNTTGTSVFRAGGNSSVNQTLTLGTGGITVNSGAGAVTIGQTPASFGNITVVLGANQVWTNDSANTLTVERAVTGSGRQLTKSGTGQIRLNGANTFSGATIVNGGNLTIGNYSGLTNTSGITVSGGTAGLQLAQVGTGSTSNTINKSLSLHGFLRTVGGSGTNLLAQSWDGAISLAGGSTITNNGNSTIDVNGQVDLGSHNLIFQTDRDGSSIDGNIIGTGGSLTKTGIRNLTLTGTNTYTGATTISSGTLVLGATGSIANSSTIDVGAGTTFNVSAVTGYTLGAAQTLTGTGTVTGAMNVAGTLSPGASPGILATGSETWINGGDYNFQMLDATAAAGTGFDQIAVTGTLDLTNLSAAGFAINLWSLASTGPDVSGDALNFDNSLNQSWAILTASGGISGFDAADFAVNVGANNGTNGFSNALGGGGFSVSADTNNLFLNFTAVPEPNVAALIGALGGILLLRRRR